MFDHPERAKFGLLGDCPLQILPTFWAETKFQSPDATTIKCATHGNGNNNQRQSGKLICVLVWECSKPHVV